MQWNVTGVERTGELLSPAIRAGVKAGAGAKQQTQLPEGETLWSKVREKVAACVVLTELTTGGHLWHLGEGGEQVPRLDIASLALQPAGACREVGLNQVRDSQA